MVANIFKRLLLSLIFQSIIIFTTVSQTTDFPNQTGWKWLFRPIRTPQNMASVSGYVISCYEAHNGDVLLHIACSAAALEHQHALNAVAFDSLGHRYDFILNNAANTNDVLMESFMLSSAMLSLRQVKYIGLEALSLDSLKTRVSPSARLKLLDSGHRAFPFPEIGQPYAFEVISIDSQKLTSKDFHGHVLLLDFWASWCSPCMAKMSDLKTLYAKYRPKGFSIIGINYDQSMETAIQYISRDNLSWPHVYVPAEDALRKLWELSCGVTTLPRLLIIDRNGVLRADVKPHELESEIEKYIKE